MFEFREEAENFTAGYQFASCLEDNADTKVSWVAFDFDAEELRNGVIFSTQWKYTEQSLILACIFRKYFPIVSVSCAMVGEEGRSNDAFHSHFLLNFENP